MTIEQDTGSSPRGPEAVPDAASGLVTPAEGPRRAWLPLRAPDGSCLPAGKLEVLCRIFADGLGCQEVCLDLGGEEPAHLADVVELCHRFHLDVRCIADRSAARRSPAPAAALDVDAAAERLLTQSLALPDRSRIAFLDRTASRLDRTVARPLPRFVEDRVLALAHGRYGRAAQKLFAAPLERLMASPVVQRLRSREAIERVGRSPEAQGGPERILRPSAALLGETTADLRDLARAREIASSGYRVVNAFDVKMNGSRFWHALQDRLALSTVLATGPRPMTLSAVFAGRAAYVGFSFAPNAQAMCLMTRAHHRLAVHVAADGQLLLLKDGEPVTPAHVPACVFRAHRLRGQLEPRLAAYGIRDHLVTQEVLLWSAERPREPAPVSLPIELSVVVVCTGFARRLSQLVRSIAEQQGFDRRHAELLVAFVPGLDGTEDVLDSARACWPDLRIVPVAAPAREQTAKGRLINQAVARASGRRVVLTDADIIFPPNLFAELEGRYRDAPFVAVAGRKMLDQRTTAELLLGVRDPVADFADLRDRAPGELRRGEARGVPLGYFQCVRRNCFERVSYPEQPHFEGADHRFALDVRRVLGPEEVMADVVVLHQDHAGSRWYGTDRHL